MKEGCCIDGNAIKEARKNMGLKTQELADMCGLDSTTIWRVENIYDHKVQVCTVIKIAEKLNISIDSIKMRQFNPEVLGPESFRW